MSYIMDPSSRDWSKGSLKGSSAPFSPDTDGDPVKLSVEDLELARKKKELKVIEDKIAHKKAVLALQKVKRGAKDMPETQAASATVKGISKQTKINNTIFKTYNHVTDKSSRVCLPLKQRVLDILSKFRRTAVQCMRKPRKQNKMRALELMISAPLENEEAHPLRLRVKVLMNQRRSPNNKVVPNDKQHNPTIQGPDHSLRTQEKDIAATGFQRFLNVLNEGVDINKLSKIVNDENEPLIVGEELPQVWPTLLEGHVDSSNTSKSSPVEEKVRLDDEQRYERMQTLLEIVGLDLGVEELGRLTDRTNDRLYGKMGDLKRMEFENEKEKEKKESEPLFKHLSTSSLPSDSASPSPLLNQHSNMTVEYSSSSNKEWDKERHRDRSERDWHRHSGIRDKDREREEDIVRELERSERDGERDGHRDRDREDRAREGESSTRERSGQRCSSTRDKDRVRERDRSERNGKGDRHRHSSTRERDKDIPVVRETNRSERNRDKDRDRDPEKDWDGGRERDRDRSRRDGGRYRSERDRDRDPEKDCDGGCERDRDRSGRDRDPEKGRDGGREKDRDRVRDRDKYRSERDRNREIDKDIESWLQRTRDRDKCPARDWDSGSDWDSHSSTRDWDRARSERDMYEDESRENSIEHYSYSMDPIYPVSHPHAFMMANYSTNQCSQYMTYHSSPYTIAFPPGWGYPPGAMPAGAMPPGNMPPGTMLPGIMLPVTMPPEIMPAGAMLPSNKPLLPNPPAYPAYPSAPPYYSYGTAALNQTYSHTQPASNLQLTSTQPASNLQLSSTQPASNLQLSSTQPASNLQLSSTQPASNLQLSSTQHATSNLQLSSTQPATSNLHLSSTQPASTAAVLPLLRKPPICQKKLAPWYKEQNKALRQVSRQMERKWRSTKLEVFRLAWEDSKAQYRKALNAARSAYFSNQIEENKNNPKCIFDTVEKLTEKQHSPSEDGLHFT
ncbi:eukaryotic translation initiation factor 3 subunit A-like [Salvelinus fontinalis]|uniref:eukaryotic translation initiation factor 3 subunit A-like n=1 Tax=Salvelinus fontinalis TaxID=8038 RepID=UPI0024867040|nr:eukaryotic translation initiation factor 3 subunit A-like [Salvelinus fontinalis]XP_055759993.1 eukaryotic translation initiation factor 3 subunit A-like [Salvelinus fontinalis]XP_055760002.1 eukaryotic translation initiation factor 3 subunit A-like [Salvelinus fontinalis]